MKQWWIKFGSQGDWTEIGRDHSPELSESFPLESFYTYYSSKPLKNGVRVVDGKLFDTVVAERDALAKEIPAIREALIDFQSTAEETFEAAIDIVKKERDELRAEAEALANALDNVLAWDDFAHLSDAEAVLERFRTKYSRKG